MTARTGTVPRSRPAKAAALPGLAARDAAVALVSGVIEGRKPLDQLLEHGAAGMPALGEEDRALARAIAATALRRHGEIAAVLRRLIEKKLPRSSGRLPAILEVAAAQILFMEVADHAAVSLAVEQAARDENARHFKGLANGVLRRMAREREALLAGADAAANAPDWLRHSWEAAYGREVAAQIAGAHLVEPPLDLTVRGDAPGWAARLGGTALPTGSVRLAARGRIEALSGFDEGAWWVQDAAAALPARLLAAGMAGTGRLAGRPVLDLCAAPGGKTAQLAAMGAAVTAVDQSAPRMARVADNLRRLRLAAETVIADALAFAPGRTFDGVLLDAPCSATGTIRRHPDIPWLKRPADIAELARLQARLLDRAAALTAPGGTLVFATCSLEPAEGEAQVRAALARLPLTAVPFVPGEVPGLAAEWLRDGALRTLPCHDPGAPGGMDGFFAIRFRRH